MTAGDERLPPEPASARRRRLPGPRSFSPAQVLVLGFLGLIALGTLALMLPLSAADGRGLSFIDALFTATSAVCVTGLVVVDTATAFSPFGQAVILTLIQFGGLGIMVMSTSVALLIGKRISLRERLALQEAMGQYAPAGVVRLTLEVLKLTVVVEAAGVLLLWISFLTDYPPGRALWLALFHSVSAFNNAGFDLFTTSLVGFAARPDVLLIIAGQFIIGGLGFTVIEELVQGRWRRGGRLSLGARMVLGTSALLLALGAVAILALEWSNGATLGAMPWWQRALAALFTAATPRTAGFNVLPTGALTQATLLFVALLMFIGASPGGTGGGIKTTTFGTIVLATRALIQGTDEVVVGLRQIPRDVVRRAWGVLALSATTVLLVTLILLVSEQQPLLAVLFETVSAFGTVGLSTGLTPDLSVVGKALIALTMYVGRVGPLTLVIAVMQKRQTGLIHYPDERVMIG